MQEYWYYFSPYLCVVFNDKIYFLVLEKKKQRDQMRMLRERERQQRDEQLRAKQEMRAHLLIEVNRVDIDLCCMFLSCRKL